MADAKNPLNPDLASIVPSISFNGAGSADQQRLAGISFTPDCNGAVDRRYFVEFINYVYSIYDKQNGTVLARVRDTQFWQSAGVAMPGAIDPRIVFIPNAGRNGQWLAVQLDIGNTVYIATTDPNDPSTDPSLGKWKGTSFALPGNDFAMIGYDASWIYLGTNTSELPPPPPPPPPLPPDARYAQIVMIPRQQALAYPPQVGPGIITTIGPLRARDYGNSLYPVVDQSGVGWPYETAIGVDTTSQRHLVFALISRASREILSSGRIEVAPFETMSMGYRVKQPFSDSNVIWGDPNIVAAPISDGFNIWLAHTIQKTDVSWKSLAVRWYRLAIDPMTRIPGLAASGEVFQSHYDCFNPAILSFGKDDYTVVSVSRSGDYSTPRKPDDAMCGNIGAYAAIVREGVDGFQMVTLKSGQADNYIPSMAQRWGDYSTICGDPANPRRAWIVNEYVLQGGQSTSQWCNVIAAIDLPPAS